MERRDEHETKLVSNDPAHTASREEAERVRRGEPPAEQVGGVSDSTAASIGGAAGGAAVGAAAGTFVFGPLGTIIGALAGVLGGWWAGKGVADASRAITPELGNGYQTHYESSSEHLADRSYDSVRHAYLLGYLARRNPDYAGRRFDEIEPELQRGWTQDLWARYGDWAGLRGYVRAAYDDDGAMKPRG
jgi:hypothetical protein